MIQTCIVGMISFIHFLLRILCSQRLTTTMDSQPQEPQEPPPKKRKKDQLNNNNNKEQLEQKDDGEEEEALPKNRFELELEFLQCLASPAYLHFLASTLSPDLSDLLPFLRYLRRTYSRPEYIRFVRYPNAFYFLDLLIDRPTVFYKEFTLPEFRNFCHQQQFLAWQYRHAHCYGVGKFPPPATTTTTVVAPAGAMTTTTEQEEDEAEDGNNGGTAKDDDDSATEDDDADADAVMKGTAENDKDGDDST
jgi:mediator of RNA polymerase II transcription subunit 31